MSRYLVIPSRVFRLRQFACLRSPRYTQQLLGNSRMIAMRFGSFGCLFAISALTLALSGCAGVTPASGNGEMSPLPSLTPQLRGTAHGGQSPISGASIQLWQTGASGYGSSSGASVIASTTSNGSGAFTISSFSCTTGTQLYLTATGGNPGGGTNSISVLMSGLVSCANASTLTFVNIDEVTTVASAYALQAFAPTGQSFTSGVQIGAPATNQTGLANAMGDVGTLVSLTSGLSNTGSANMTLPYSEINTIANALAICVNSTGTGSSGCTTLFGYTHDASGNAPTDTLAAAFNLARTAGGTSANVSNIVTLGGSSPPFSPALATAPPDLTLGITYTGSAIDAPTALAVDAGGNVWIANSVAASGSGSVTELSHTGTALSGAAGYTAGAFNTPSSIAIDLSGNVWVTNSGNSTLTELTSAGANASGSPFSGGGLSTPTSVAIDALGYVWIANSGNSSVSAFSSNGTADSPSGGFTATGLGSPVAVAINPH